MTSSNATSDEFKRDAVSLIVNQGYSFRAAADAVGVGEGSLRLWHRQLAPKPEPGGEVDGSAKIARTLETDPELETARVNTVAKAMREMGLKSRVSKKFRPSTTQADPSKTPAPNWLKQKFTATAANQKWVADITYLPTAGELLHHSDRGCRYTSDDYQSTLRPPRDHLFDEPHRVRLRQRNLGAIFAVAEARTDEILIVRRSPGRKAPRLSLYRDFLQYRAHLSVA